eukprot:GHVH01008134.1.p1 GENE.GHVH01008134.1~~GHVH01008134.1.p1  ORF type:complete len:1748 (+),score=235.37 GHVH01008134.1:455-5245(+)
MTATAGVSLSDIERPILQSINVNSSIRFHYNGFEILNSVTIDQLVSLDETHDDDHRSWIHDDDRHETTLISSQETVLDSKSSLFNDDISSSKGSSYSSLGSNTLGILCNDESSSDKLIDEDVDFPSLMDQIVSTGMHFLRIGVRLDDTAGVPAMIPNWSKYQLEGDGLFRSRTVAGFDSTSSRPISAPKRNATLIGPSRMMTKPFGKSVCLVKLSDEDAPSARAASVDKSRGTVAVQLTQRVVFPEKVRAANSVAAVKVEGFESYVLPHGTRHLKAAANDKPVFRLFQLTRDPVAFSLLNRCNSSLARGAQISDFSQGTSGAYRLVCNTDGPLTIFKPLCEEPFSPNNVKQYVGPLGCNGFRSGVKSGEGAPREVIAYLMDQWVFGGGLMGVPPTFYVESLSGVYNYKIGNSELKTQPTYPNSANTPMDRHQYQVQSMRNLLAPRGLSGMTTFLQTQSNSTDGFESTINESTQTGARQKHPKKKSYLKNSPTAQNIVSNEDLRLSGGRTQSRIPPSHSQSDRHYYWKQGSLQTYIPFTETSEDFGSEIMSIYEVQLISFMDLVLCNMDRNEGNLICIRNDKIPSMLKAKGRMFQQLSTKWRLFVVNELFHDPGLHGISRDYTSIRVTPSGRVSGFHVIPIDHGLVLPEDFAIDDLDIVWMSFKHVHFATHPGILNLLKKMDAKMIRRQLQNAVQIPVGAWMTLQMTIEFLKFCLIDRGYSIFETARLLTNPERATGEFRLIERSVRLALLRTSYTYMLSTNKDLRENPILIFNFLNANWQTELKWQTMQSLQKVLFMDRIEYLQRTTSSPVIPSDVTADQLYDIFTSMSAQQSNLASWRNDSRQPSSSELDCEEISDEERFIQMTKKNTDDHHQRDSNASDHIRNYSRSERTPASKQVDDLILTRLKVDVDSIDTAFGHPVNEFSSWIVFALMSIDNGRKCMSKLRGGDGYTDRLTPYLEETQKEDACNHVGRQMSKKDQLYRKIIIQRIRGIFALKVLNSHPKLKYIADRIGATYGMQCIRAAQNVEILRTFFGLNDISGYNELKHYPTHQKMRVAQSLSGGLPSCDADDPRDCLTDRPEVKYSMVTGLPYFQGPKEMVKLYRQEFCTGAAYLSLVELHCRKTNHHATHRVPFEMKSTSNEPESSHEDSTEQVAEDTNFSLSLSYSSEDVKDLSNSPTRVTVDPMMNIDIQRFFNVAGGARERGEGEGEVEMDEEDSPYCRSVWDVRNCMGRPFKLPIEDIGFHDMLTKLFQEYLRFEIDMIHPIMMGDRVTRLKRVGGQSLDGCTPEELVAKVERLDWTEDTAQLVTEAIRVAGYRENEGITKDWEYLYNDPSPEINQMSVQVVPNVHRDLHGAELDPFDVSIGHELWESNPLNADDSVQDNSWGFAFSRVLDHEESHQSLYDIASKESKSFNTWMKLHKAQSTKNLINVREGTTAKEKEDINEEGPMQRMKGSSRLKRKEESLQSNMSSCSTRQRQTKSETTQNGLEDEEALSLVSLGMTRRRGKSALRRKPSEAVMNVAEDSVSSKDAEDTTIECSILATGHLLNGLLAYKMLFASPPLTEFKVSTHEVPKNDDFQTWIIRSEEDSSSEDSV